MRLLVTGPRAGVDRYTVYGALDSVLADHPGEPLTIVAGDAECVDTYAMDWVDAAPVRHPGVRITKERHEANWKMFGKAAGPIRNQRMVSLGADQALVMGQGDTPGTGDCLGRIRRAGIPISRHSLLARKGGDAA